MSSSSAETPDKPEQPAPLPVKRVAVDSSQLMRVAARPSLLEYLRKTWQARRFIIYDAKVRFSSEYSEDKLGLLWTVINPILLGISYYLIFGLLLQTSRGVENFIGFLIIGVFSFQYSSRAVNKGAHAISSNRRVIQAFSFPRLTLPLSIAVREAFGYLPILATMIFMILVFPPVEEFTWRWLLIVPAFLGQLMFSFGISLILARIIAFHPDVSNIVSFFLRIWMYTSGVFYSLDRYANYPLLLEILSFNPLHQVMTILRQSMLYGISPDLTSWLILWGWGVGSVVFGVIFFWLAEERYGKDVTAI